MTLYAIGDIQGCDSAFAALLDAIRFDADRDRLWLVGDLVNRGPASLAVLRRVIGLGDRVISVLGNHDLHLLAAAAGVRPVGSRDTFGDVLQAPDADQLVDWLRRRPLLHVDRITGRALVHAGIPPGWDVDEALEHAGAVEAALRGRSWRDAVAGMYGNEPAQWRSGLEPSARLRYTINALTRMRYCDPQGRLDFDCSGPPGSQPRHLAPWFDVAGRRAMTSGWHIVFGHWSALGVMRRDDITALDSGCVWGRELTAVALEGVADAVTVSCADQGPPAPGARAAK